MMVTGPNGAGKSSLFRVIGELWPLSSGTVVKPSAEDVLFVPQKPYLVDGTLRDQIIYPDDANTMEVGGEDVGAVYCAQCMLSFLRSLFLRSSV